METQSQYGVGPSIPIEAFLPLGAPTVSIDDKWRIRMPLEFKRYLERLSGLEVNLWITSLDNKSVQLFLVPQWYQKVGEIEASSLEPTHKRAILETANRNGARGKLDAADRITLHQELRQRLGLESKGTQEMRIQYTKGYLELVPVDVYEERYARLEAALPDALHAMEAAGIL